MAPAAFRLGDFIVEPGTDRVVHAADGLTTSLEPKTMAVLLALAERPGEVVSSEELIHQVWLGRPMGENPVYKAVAKLRRALRDESGEPRYIETISRKGYRLLLLPAPLEATRPGPARESATTPPLPPPVTARSRWRHRYVALTAGLLFPVLLLGWFGAAHRPAVRPPPPTVANGRGESPRLPPALRQTYLMAMSELRERRPGFEHRLHEDAASLVAAAPDVAEGHALLAIACSFEAFYSNVYADRATQPAGSRAGFMTCAREAVDKALQEDSHLALGQAAAGLVALNESWLCTANCDVLASLDAARTNLERAVALDPSLPEAHTWLLMLDMTRGDFREAEQQAGAALTLDPLNPVATFNFAEFLLDRGDYALAHQRLLLLARPGAPAYVYEQLFASAIAASDIADAQHWVDRLLAAEPDRDSRVLAAAMLLRIGNVAEARHVMRSARDDGWLDQGAALWAALMVHVALEGPQGARDYLARQQAVRQKHVPASPLGVREWEEFQGFALVMARDPAAARPYLEAAFGARGPPRIRFDDIDDEADCADALAWTYRQLGASERSREIADGVMTALDRVASEGYGKSWQFQRNRALTLALSGRPDEARAVIAHLSRWQRPSEWEHDPRWSGILPVDAGKSGAIALSAVPRPAGASRAPLRDRRADG